MTVRRVQWFTTGGTIDSRPYADPDNPPKDATNDPFSHVPFILKDIVQDIRHETGQPFTFPIELEQMWTRDSKYIAEKEIAELAQRIRKDKKHDVFVVTHGTDTMPKNSRLMMQYLDKELQASGKSVIFTGAMLPLANGKSSDGKQNLRFIVEHSDDRQVFPPGVHVVMHEQVFSPIGLRKDFDKMEFYTTEKIKEIRKDERMAGVTGAGIAL